MQLRLLTRGSRTGALRRAQRIWCWHLAACPRAATQGGHMSTPGWSSSGGGQARAVLIHRHSLTKFDCAPAATVCKRTSRYLHSRGTLLQTSEDAL